MPTAARLAAAVLCAATAWLASRYFVQLLPEGTDAIWFPEVNAAVGVFVGWKVLGPLSGVGYSKAVNNALRAAATMFFYALIGHSVFQMIRLALRKSYDSPMEAVVGIFDEAVTYGLMALKSPEVVATMLIGAILAAWITEWVSARWR